MTEQQAREEICRVGHSLFERGYVHATAGNISVLLDDTAGGGFLITPTDACLGFLEPARLARLDAQGQQISGDKASKTIALHTRIYAAARALGADTRCVIHTHSTHCVALSLKLSTQARTSAQPPAPASSAARALAMESPMQGAREPVTDELLAAITPYFVMKVGHVPLIPYHRPGDPAAAQWVADTIARYGQQGTPIRAVMLSRLGPNVWHDSPAAAMAVLEELEETARLACIASASAELLPIEPLNDSQINELRQTFGAQW